MGSARNLTWLRAWTALLGIYFLYYTAALWPYYTILFGAGGFTPEEEIWTPASLTALYIVFALRALSALGLAAGVFRRSCALALYLANLALTYRNLRAMGGPELPYLNFQLLLLALIPRETDGGGFTRLALLLAWLQMGASFLGTGWLKVVARHGSWLDGSALELILTDHYLRHAGAAWVVRSLPADVWRLLTWAVVGSQLTMLPALVTRRTRMLCWACSFAIHAGAIVLLDLTQVSLGMCVALLFLLPLAREKRNALELWSSG